MKAERKKTRQKVYSVITPSRGEEQAAQGGVNSRWGLALVIFILVAVTSEAVWLVLKKIELQYGLQYVRQLGERSGPPERVGVFYGPRVLRLDRAGHRLAIVDIAFNKVVVLDANGGSCLAEINLAQVATPERPAFNPHNLDFDAMGNLYILDRVSSEVIMVSPGYQVTARWKTEGVALELAVSPEGKVWVGNTTGEVVRYSRRGQAEKRIFTPAPGFMATDETNAIYLVDTKIKQVRIFSSTGQPLRSWPVRFSPFNSPSICIRNDRIYLGEAENKRILAVTREGGVTQEIFHELPLSFAVGAGQELFMIGSFGIDQFMIQKTQF